MARQRTMTHSERAKDLRVLGEPFPNLTEAGSYSHASQLIELSSVTGDDASHAFASDDIFARLKVLPLLEHELQHQSDHLATVWGRENLVSLFNAYNVRALNMQHEFGRVTESLRGLRSVHFNDYYTWYGTNAGRPSDGRRWVYRYAAGVQLGPDGSDREDSPIPFTHFSTQDGDLLVRVPFTVASLFEVRAMAAEMKVQIDLMNRLPEEAQTAEIAAWERKSMGELYDPYLAMYSVVAHHLANTFHAKDVVSTYRNASVIAGLCLNLPRSLFSRLEGPDDFKEWGARNEAMKARCDRGYLFMALIVNGKRIPLENLDDWLADALPASRVWSTPAN